ncbi:hypothetical protein FRB95_005788 [Tulasnella sp. JGI-2019a]|nr:hypothetical protein FRB95_005788 [Tulasnella sp. JGI-2019a]
MAGVASQQWAICLEIADLLPPHRSEVHRILPQDERDLCAPPIPSAFPSGGRIFLLLNLIYAFFPLPSIQPGRWGKTTHPPNAYIVMTLYPSRVWTRSPTSSLATFFPPLHTQVSRVHVPPPHICLSVRLSFFAGEAFRAGPNAQLGHGRCRGNMSEALETSSRILIASGVWSRASRPNAKPFRSIPFHPVPHPASIDKAMKKKKKSTGGDTPPPLSASHQRIERFCPISPSLKKEKEDRCHKLKRMKLGSSKVLSGPVTALLRFLASGAEAGAAADTTERSLRPGESVPTEKARQCRKT